MYQSLTFNEVTLVPVVHNNQPWIQSKHLAAALGYKDEGSVNKIYERNKNEFTASMTQLVEIADNVKLTFPVQTRIFSLRGCHLLAMFSRTSVAKAFRVWVLDVLETLHAAEPQPALPSPDRLSKSTDPERRFLFNLVSLWCTITGSHYSFAWTQVNKRFGVSSVDEMRVAQVEQAITWVQERIDTLQAKMAEVPAVENKAGLPVARSMESHRLALEKYTRAIAGVLQELHERIKLEGPRDMLEKGYFDPNKRDIYQNTLDAMRHHREAIDHHRRAIEHSLDSLAYLGRAINAVVRL